MDKIDLVYTWVDDTDTEWQKKKSNFLKEYNIESESNSNCRFKNNDELKYSLRSVEKYAPWINHIYIVTDNQVPEWLNTDNPKVTIIDHKDIMPEDALPTFNSIAIENCICNIPNLSEYFLYANDDMFICDNISPGFFYDKNKFPVFRFNRAPKEEQNTQYEELLIHARKMIQDKYNKYYNYRPHHCIDAYRKSDFKKFQEIYKDEVRQCVYSRFRQNDNFERFAYILYCCAIKNP